MPIAFQQHPVNRASSKWHRQFHAARAEDEGRRTAWLRKRQSRSLDEQIKLFGRNRRKSGRGASSQVQTLNVCEVFTNQGGFGNGGFARLFHSFAPPQRTCIAAIGKALHAEPTLALSCPTSFSSSRMRRISSGNCCTAIICRLACLSGAAGMPSTVPLSGMSRMTPDFAPTVA